MESMNKLILTIGLPRSGKSTWALKQGCPIVASDAIRLSMFGKLWWPPGEQQVMAAARTMVRALFFAGHSTVIFDSISLTQESRKFWLPTSDCPWVLEYLLMQTPADVCIERAVATGLDYLVPVIQHGAKVLGEHIVIEDFSNQTKDEWNEEDFIGCTYKKGDQ